MTKTKEFRRSELLNFEEIDTKLIFGRFIILDLSNSHKLEIKLTASKDNLNKEKDRKTKVKQLRNEK